MLPQVTKKSQLDNTKGVGYFFQILVMPLPLKTYKYKPSIQLILSSVMAIEYIFFHSKKHAERVCILTTSSHIKQVQAIPSCSCCDQNMRRLQLILVICSSRVLYNIYAHNLPFNILPNNFRSKCIDHCLWTSNFFNCGISIKIWDNKQSLKINIQRLTSGHASKVAERKEKLDCIKTHYLQISGQGQQ